jgi:hypothetical protein
MEFACGTMQLILDNDVCATRSTHPVEARWDEHLPVAVRDAQGVLGEHCL